MKHANAEEWDEDFHPIRIQGQRTWLFQFYFLWPVKDPVRALRANHAARPRLGKIKREKESKHDTEYKAYKALVRPVQEYAYSSYSVWDRTPPRT